MCEQQGALLWPIGFSCLVALISFSSVREDAIGDVKRACQREHTYIPLCIA